MRVGIGVVPCLLAAWVWIHPQDLREPDFREASWRGFDLVYSLDYDQAKTSFEELGQARPLHPGPSLYLATVFWLEELLRRHELELDRFAAPGYFAGPSQETMPAEARRAFFLGIERSQQKARKILDEEPSHRDARYYLGLSHGVLASFAITIERDRKQAFSHGKKAYAYHRDLVREDPDYFDAYMSVGMYEYIVGSLPWYFKWLAAMVGYRGSRERGMEYLRLAVEKGEYVSQDARVLQMVLLVREGDYKAALENARALHRRYPRNFLLHLNQAQILEWMGETEQAVKQYLGVLERVRQGRANYHRLPLETFRYSLGRKLLQLEREPLALDLFEASARDGATPEPQKALSHLEAGQIHDLRGRRPQAVRHYQEVLSFRDFGGSHGRAKRWLKAPYRPAD